MGANLGTIILGSGDSVSFSAIKTAYKNAGGSMPGAISLKALRNAKFQDSDTVPGSGPIVVGTVFRQFSKGSVTGGETFLIPITGVTLSVKDTEPEEGTDYGGSTLSNYAQAVISPSNANGGIQIEFTSSNSSAASPKTTGYQTGSTGSNFMDYVIHSVTGNTDVTITVNVKENGSLLFSKTQSITIQENTSSPPPGS
jgi:hypothetical protein